MLNYTEDWIKDWPEYEALWNMIEKRVKARKQIKDESFEKADTLFVVTPGTQ